MQALCLQKFGSILCADVLWYVSIMTTLSDAPANQIALNEADHAAPSLAGMLLLVAMAFALPFALYPTTHTYNGPTSHEILNLNFLVGWMGLAHFIYAYYGQAKALSWARKKIAPFLVLLIVGAAVLLELRQLLGYMMFSFVMWIYFLPHFVRAELLFTNTLNDKPEASAKPGVYIFPALAFAFFTFALFGPVEFISNRWNLILLGEATVVAGFLLNLRQQLKDPQLSKYALLAVALIAEGLVWATYRQYMVFQFQQGVYVFHIAMASFYHYLRAYGYARRIGISKGKPVGKMFLPGILAINFGVIGVGYVLSNYFADAPTRYVFDVSYFTFWVGLHQYASDVFNWLKRKA
ncbi:MAG: hypothetical protein QG574_4144 [Cyanobacteriota bacterium erpe_2018_sw_21hr_WHONDRS-SW48-000092_B_bin.40]|nr:hypothetical protein [Cyanobacteriota bacterium erpe_2018_sw_21hr_WHONDRS-SW48-000092_B_bin.40]